ncbi:MAG: hypothetical protein ACOYD7_00500 [Raoultibacter sp.]|jgi:hypothetical protein
MRKLFTAVTWIAVVLAVGVLILFIASKIGQFESIQSMMDFVMNQF